MSDEKVIKENKIKVRTNKSNKENKDAGPLTYNFGETFGDKLDKLFPEFKPSRKKEDKK